MPRGAEHDDGSFDYHDHHRVSEHDDILDRHVKHIIKQFVDASKLSGGHYGVSLDAYRNGDYDQSV